MDSIPNVSPNYGLYDRKSSKEAIADRRERRRLSGTSSDPESLAVEVTALKQDQAASKKRIAELETFRAGMNGDENIKVDDNKITWIGRNGNGVASESIDAVIIENGEVYAVSIPILGNPVPFPTT